MIRRGDTWYERAPWGGWLRWDEPRQEWVESAEPPPPPEPPSGAGGEPPPPWDEEWPDLEPGRGRHRPVRTLIAAGVALALLVALGLGPLSALLQEQDLQPEVDTLVDPASSPPPPLDGVPDDKVRTARDAAACVGAPPDAGNVPGLGPLVLGEGLVDRVGEIVGAIRGLDLQRPVEPRFIPPEEMRRRILREATTGEQRRQTRLIGRILVLLGAMAPGTDLVGLTEDLVGDSILGYYVPEKGSLFVRSPRDRETISPSGVVTLAHEIGHALVDQNLPWPLDPDERRARSEAQFARRALVEGDAVLLQEHFAALALSPEQNAQRFTEESPDISQVPHFVLRSFAFPYLEGASFVCDLYSRGGWKAVDVAYRSPPRSTDQIVFPSRLGERRTGPDPLPLGDPGKGWERRDAAPIGMAELLFLFEAPGNDTRRAWPAYDARVYAGALAQGWTTTWSSGRGIAIGISLSQRDDYPDGALCTAVEAWYRTAYPEARDVSRPAHEEMALRHDRGSAVLDCTPGHVRLGLAPRPGEARATVQEEER